MSKLWILMVLALVATVAGCVEREMVITSEPEGALVMVSDVEKGRTPLTIDFEWYGDYEFILRSDGCETLVTSREINAPIYEIPPLDLFSALAPWTYHDRRYLHFKMDKLKVSSDEDLIARADTMAQQTRQAVPR